MLMSTNETGAGGVFDLCPHRGIAMRFYINTTLHTEAELFQPLGFDYRNSRPSSEAG